MPKFKNTNPLTDERKREEDANYLRSHDRIRKCEKILEKANPIEDPEIENLEDIGVFISLKEESNAPYELCRQGIHSNSYLSW